MGALAAGLLAGSPGALGVQAPAAGRPAEYTIAVYVSHDKAGAGPEEVDAIVDFVTRRVNVLNGEGGIGGRPIRAVFYDDFGDEKKTGPNVDAALADPNLIAMVGLWSSSRGAPVVDRIGRSGVPFISEWSVETMFANYPAIYSLTRSVRDEQAVFKAFARDRFRRIAFVGAEDDVYTREYHRHLVDPAGAAAIVHTFWLKGNVDDQADLVDGAIAEIKQAAPDLIFLSIGSKKGGSFLRRAGVAGLTAPAFIALGSIDGLAAELARQQADYGGDLYEIAEGGIANLNNERLEQLMRRPDAVPERKYKSYAQGYGARYADLVALVAAAADESLTPGGVEAPGKRPPRDIVAVRRSIAQALARLKEGRRVWRGWAQDWSFTAERASSERALIVWKPAGQPSAILAPLQFIRTPNGLAQIPVLYVHLHMMRIFRVDSGDKSFEAEFFFTMRSETELPIAAVEFTNAYRGAGGDKALINIREVHQEAALGGEPRTRVFKISGKFMFEPDLRKYPFDEQVFSISFQPASTSAAFLLQPPAEDVRRQTFAVDGWRVQSDYVGTGDLIIGSVSGKLSEARIIPYYNFNYTWVMKRQVVDYILRVIVPLSLIMIVAYLAIFIPRSDFQSIIAIQVTALLSAIALYLALNQPSADDATLSDQIFVVAYATISMMIALSIFEVNPTLMRSRTFLAAVQVAQVYLVPIVALALIAHVIFLAASDVSLFEAIARRWRGLAAAAS